MKNLFVLALIVSCFASCADKGHNHAMTPQVMDSLRDDLLKTDIAFSALSEEKGRNAAFIEYAGEHATMLRPFSKPLTGKASIKAMLTAHPDSFYKLTWVPISADVARSGEIGFTYGTYSLEIRNVGHEEGTYATVWHKDSTKAWKFLLDTGNEGLSSSEKKVDEKVDAKEAKLEHKVEAKKK